MDFNEEEKKIREMLDPIKGESVPKKVLEGFEDDVLEKIHRGGPGISFGIVVPVVCLAFIAAGVFFFLMPKEVQKVQVEEVEIQQPIVTQSPVVLRKEALPAKPLEILGDLPGRQAGAQSDILTDDSFESLGEELFILEMLGEDEGLLDDLDLLEADAEFFFQGISPIVA